MAVPPPPGGLWLIMSKRTLHAWRGQSIVIWAFSQLCSVFFRVYSCSDIYTSFEKGCLKVLSRNKIVCFEVPSDIPAPTFTSPHKTWSWISPGLCYRRQFALFLKSPFGKEATKYVCNLWKYSNHGLPRAASKTLVKLRISSHKLRIETGRYDNIPRDERLCSLRNYNRIEDETHFLLDCPSFPSIKDRNRDVLL